VEPVLEEQHAFVRQHLLEAHDLVDLLAVLRRAHLAVDALHHRFGMPGAEEHADLALWRQRLPEAPQVRPLLLFV
jgi:hypothetical protein